MASSPEEATLAAADAAGRAPADAGQTPPSIGLSAPRPGLLGAFHFRAVASGQLLDRGIINLLIEPIKRDLHLTDVQVSVLMGFAFVIFYIVLGFPIASLADLKSRRLIVSFGLFCWSGMTALCGVAQNFWSFFLFRVGVGVGEACTGPATLSMLPTSSRRQSLRAQSHS